MLLGSDMLLINIFKVQPWQTNEGDAVSGQSTDSDVMI